MLTELDIYTTIQRRYKIKKERKGEKNHGFKSFID